jgi:hypothetical protein
MSADKAIAKLSADEVRVITLMRQNSQPDVDFLVIRRDGRLVNLKTTTNHAKDFSTQKLREGESVYGPDS